MSDPIAMIAEGREPTWEETFQHPTHGPLTFRVTRKLTNTDWLRQSATRDAIINRLAPRDETGNPEYGVRDVGDATTIFAGACAGLMTIMEPVQVGEERITDEVPGHEKVKKIYYDPLVDDALAFPDEVWGAFLQWRSGLLQDGVGELKKGFATTGGAEPGEPSLDPTGSHPTTPVSKRGETGISSESSATGS